MKKKTFFILALALVMLITFSACNGNTQTPDSGTTTAQGTVIIQFSSDSDVPTETGRVRFTIGNSPAYSIYSGNAPYETKYDVGTYSFTASSSSSGYYYVTTDTTEFTVTEGSTTTITITAKSNIKDDSDNTHLKYLATSRNEAGEITAYQVMGFGDSVTDKTSVTIPANYDNVPVTSIGYYAFRDASALATVTFAEDSNIDTIGANAFRGTAITTITLPAGVTVLNGGEFRNCVSLTNADLSKTDITSLNYTFYGATSLTSVSLPATITSIDSYTFANNTALTTITFAGTKSEWEAFGVVNTHIRNNNDITVNCSGNETVTISKYSTT